MSSNTFDPCQEVLRIVCINIQIDMHLQEVALRMGLDRNQLINQFIKEGLDRELAGVSTKTSEYREPGYDHVELSL